MGAYDKRMSALGRMAFAGLCAWTLCAVPLVAADEQSDTAPVEDAPSLTERLEALIDVLNEYGVAFDEEAGFETVAESLISAADPLGGFQTRDTEDSRARRRAGKIYDAGVRIQITNDSVRITRILDDTPAQSTGLEEGDTLLEIDETDVSEVGLHRMLRLLRSDTPQPVTLTVQSQDGAVSTQEFERVNARLEDIESREEFPFQLAYIQVNRLREGTGAAIAENIREWANAERYGIIVDFRGADGDDLDSVKAVAELFAKPGSLLFAFRDKDDQDLRVEHAGETPPLTLPIMVLVDAQTGGAAEVLAAVLSDSVRGAMLFGQTTRGDMLVREIVELDDGARLYLASRRLVTADGTVYVGKKGVRPDVVTARTDENSAIYKPVRSSRTEVLDEEIEQEKLYHRVNGDAALRRAVDVLLGLKALDIRPRGNTAHHTR